MAMDMDQAQRLKAQTEREIAELLQYFVNKTGVELKGMDFTYHTNISGEAFGLQVQIRAEL